MSKIIKSIILACLVSTTAKADVVLQMPSVALQDESWECGIQSANRVLAAYDNFQDFGSMRSNIGKYRFKFPFVASYTQDVCEEVTKIPGLGQVIKELVCKPVTRATTIPVDLVGINIGRSPKSYLEKFRGYDAGFTLEEKVSEQRIIQLLDQGIPVIALHLVGEQGWSTEVAGVKVGFSYPQLHYYTVAGYNTRGFYIYDTETNQRDFETFEEFRSKFEWGGWNTSSAVHQYLLSEGVIPRSILYINRPVSSHKRIDLTNPDVLMSLHRGCDEVGKSRTSDCTAAAHRYCVAKGFGGGVTQQLGQTEIGISCFQTSQYRIVSSSEMQKFHGVCVDPQSPGCMAASQLYCNSLGSSAGLVQEVGPNAFAVACFDGPYVGVSHNEMKKYHGECTPGQSSGAACMAASQNYCSQVQGKSGGLIQQVGPDAFGVACFDGNYFIAPVR